MTALRLGFSFLFLIGFSSFIATLAAQERKPKERKPKERELKEREPQELEPQEAREPDASPLKTRLLRVDDRARMFMVAAPAAAKTKKTPVVFVLHGGGGNCRQFARKLAIEKSKLGRQFIVVYPQSTALDRKPNWNDGRTPTQKGKEALAKVDDVKYLLAVLEQIEKDYQVDPSRVYATGASNGGFMVNKLANETSRFAAIAPVIGSMSDDTYQNFKPPKSTSVLFINGTADPLVPYLGGRVGTRRLDLGKSISIHKAVKKWVAHNQCQENPTINALEDKDPNDGTKSKRFVYGSGQNNTVVELIEIEGGGHNWPGATPYATKRLIGNSCQDFDATQVILRFFLDHPAKAGKDIPAPGNQDSGKKQAGDKSK